MTIYADALARWAAAVWRDRYAALPPAVARERIRKALLYGHYTPSQAALLLAKVEQ